MAYRPTDKTVLRAGFASPSYALARPASHESSGRAEPASRAPNSLAFVSHLSDRIPTIQNPRLGTDHFRWAHQVPAARRLRARADSIVERRGAARAPWGFVKAATSARADRSDGFRELNWSPIGGEQAGRQLNQTFGARPTRLVAPVATAGNALQTRVDRRFANGIQIGELHWRNRGNRRQSHSDGALRINIPEVRAEPISATDGAHAQHHEHHGAAVWSGLPLAEWRRGVADRGRWQVNNIVSFQRHAVQRYRVRHLFNAPENEQRADQVKPDVRDPGALAQRTRKLDPLGSRRDAGPLIACSTRGRGRVVDPACSAGFGCRGRWTCGSGSGVQLTNTPRFNPSRNVSNLASIRTAPSAT